MNAYFVTFRSLTTAQRALLLLRQNGIQAELTKSPRQISLKGCGYALKLPAGDGYFSARLLRQEKILYDRVYLIGPGSSPREVRL